MCDAKNIKETGIFDGIAASPGLHEGSCSLACDTVTLYSGTKLHPKKYKFSLIRAVLLGARMSDTTEPTSIETCRLLFLLVEISKREIDKLKQETEHLGRSSSAFTFYSERCWGKDAEVGKSTCGVRRSTLHKCSFSLAHETVIVCRASPQEAQAL